MAEVTVKTASGGEAGRVQLDDAIFGVQPNVAVMHQVVTAQLANRRAGTHSTKSRAEVRGGGAKPYRQKGTGNARQGSIRSPQFSGGGVAHGPRPRSYAQRTPKKMIKLALRSALSDRASEGKVIVVDDWGISTPRTKEAAAALAALGLDGGRVLVVVESFDTAAARSFRNLPLVQLIKAGELNAYDVLCNDWIVFSESTLPTAAAEPDTPAETAEPAVHPNDPAEGAREEPTDEPLVAEHPDDPAEGAAEATDESSGGARDRQRTDGSARAAVSEGPGTAEESASDEAESSEPQVSETDDAAPSQDDTRSAVAEGSLEHDEAGSAGAEPSSGGDAVAFGDGESTEDEQ